MNLDHKRAEDTTKQEQKNKPKSGMVELAWSYQGWLVCNVTWAAMTRCLSAISLHFWHWQSLQLQKRLWPFSGDTKPWFLQREHLGIRDGFLTASGPLLCSSSLILTGGYMAVSLFCCS